MIHFTSKKEQCIKIKSLLERLSGVQDIGKRSRRRNISDIKKTYYKLCDKFSTASLSLMAEVLGNYDHSTAIHGIKEFNNLYKSKSFSCNNLYEDAYAVLKKEYQETIDKIQSYNNEIILNEIEYHEKQIQKLINKIEIN